MKTPLPKAPLERALLRARAARLPNLRETPLPPCRHPEVTLLIYWYPLPDATGYRPLDGCEFALRQSLTVLGQLPTVIVTDRSWAELDTLAAALGAEIQEEPTLTPGDIWGMSLDCIARLHTRFTTPHVLIVQSDGMPLRDDLADFLRYDYVGAPCVTAGWKERVADLLGITVLNGGFSLRSRKLCRAVAKRWAVLWRFLLKAGDKALSEDIFYTRTLRVWDPWLRFRYRFAPSPIARQFSVECLDGAIPVARGANPMGFHGRLTAKAFFEDTTRLTVVSVVRDKACYARCVRENPHLAGATFVAYDNTQENRPIPQRYNAFLESLPEETEWIFFAHEDMELLEDPRPVLARECPLDIYGHIGTRRLLCTFVFPFGWLIDSHRDGSDKETLHTTRWSRELFGNFVDAFDCCGFYVHADAIRTWGLRFDERCPWDLYAEDLCYQFALKSHRLPRILTVRAHHWSHGNPDSPTFHAAKAALDAKYKDTFFAGGTCTFTIGQRPPLRFRIYRRLVRLLFWRKFKKRT